MADNIELKAELDTSDITDSFADAKKQIETSSINLNINTDFIDDIKKAKSDIEKKTKTNFNIRPEIKKDDLDKASKKIKDTLPKEHKIKIGEQGLSVIKTSLISIGTLLTTIGLAKGLESLSKGAINAVSNTIDLASNIQDTSASLGLSTKGFQEWQYVMQQNGSSIDDYQNSIGKFNDAIYESGDKSSKAAKLFNSLGIDIEKAGSKEEIFNSTIRGLQSLGDTVERNKIASELFGKSYIKMIPLLNSSASDIDRLKQEANDLGIVLGDDLLNAGSSLGDSLDSLKSMFSSLTAGALAPLMPVLLNVGTELRGSLAEAFKQIGPMVENLAPIIAQLGTQFIALIPQLMPFITMLMTQLLPTLFSLAMQLLPIFMEALNALMPVLPPLVNAFMLILQALTPLIPILAQIITDLMPSFIDIIAVLVAAIVPLINIFLELVQSVLPYVIDIMNWIVETTIPFFMDGFNAILKFLGPLFNAIKALFDVFAKAFQGDWEGLWTSVGDFLVGIFDGLLLFVEGVANQIISLVNMIIRGINSINPSFNIKEIQMSKIATIGKYDDIVDKAYKTKEMASSDTMLTYDQLTGKKFDQSMKKAGDYTASEVAKASKQGIESGIGARAGDWTGQLASPSAGKSAEPTQVYNIRNIYVTVSDNKIDSGIDINAIGDMFVGKLKQAGAI